MRFVYAALVVVLAGCAHVPTWQRSLLQSRPMTTPLDPCTARLDAHLWAAREAMTTAGGVGATACGCN